MRFLMIETGPDRNNQPGNSLWSTFGVVFVVGLVSAFVSMVIFRGYFRIAGVFLAGVVCYMMAYYTEYFKQYIDGRHFQMTDVELNWYGCLTGIICMVGSYFINRLLVKMSG